MILRTFECKIPNRLEECTRRLNGSINDGEEYCEKNYRKSAFIIRKILFITT